MQYWSWFQKSLAGTLSLALGLPSGAWGVPQSEAFWSNRRAALQRSAPVPSPKSWEQTPWARVLKQGPGRLRLVSAGPSPEAPVVIQILDVHRHREAQEHIAQAVSQVAPFVDRVALEGAWRVLDLQRFRDHPEPAAVQRASRVFFENHHISGPVLAALTARGAFPPLVGVDDPLWHKANVAAYRRSSRKMEREKSKWAEEGRRLAEDKERLYSPAQKALDQAAETYRRGDMGPQAFLRYLRGTGPLPPSLQTPLDLWEAAERPVPMSVEKEKKEFFDRWAKAHRGAALPVFKALVSGADVDLSEYPALEKFLNTVAKADQYPGESFHSDLEGEILRRARALASPGAERALVERAHLHRQRGDLLNFFLSSKGWADYHQHPANPRPGTAPFEKFYRAASVRDRALAENLLHRMNPTDARKVSVLVTGGYHAEGVARVLAQAGVTVISFTPRFEAPGTGSSLQIFLQKGSSLAKHFPEDQQFLAPAPLALLDEELHLPAAIALESASPQNSFRSLVGPRLGAVLGRTWGRRGELGASLGGWGIYRALRSTAGKYRFVWRESAASSGFKIGPWLTALEVSWGRFWFRHRGGFTLGVLWVLGLTLGMVTDVFAFPVGGGMGWGESLLGLGALGTIAQVKFPVKKFPRTVSVNLLDFGSFLRSRKKNQYDVGTHGGLRKTEEVLDRLKQLGFTDLYINHLYLLSRVGKVVHTQSERKEKVLDIQISGGRVALLVREYEPKRYETLWNGGTLRLTDRWGNNFSVDDMGLLNPSVVPGDTHEERWAQLALFAKKVHAQGLTLTVDLIPWLSPGTLTPERLGWAKKVEEVPEGRRAESDLALLRNKPGNILFEAGSTGRKYWVGHYMGVDQIYPNFKDAGYFTYLEGHLRRLIDAGVDRVRVDMAHDLISEQDDPHWGQWSRLILGAKKYSSDKYHRPFHFLMEAYGDWTEKFLARFPKEQVYYPEVHHNYVKIANPRHPEHRKGLDFLFAALAYANKMERQTQTRGRFLIFPSSYDLPSLFNLGGPREAFLKLLLIYEHWGVPTLMDLRELAGESGHNIPQAGGQGQDHSGSYEHPFPVVPRRDHIELLTALDSETSPAHWVKEWRERLRTATSVRILVSGRPSRSVTVFITGPDGKVYREELDFYPELPKESSSHPWFSRVQSWGPVLLPLLGVLSLTLWPLAPVEAAGLVSLGESSGIAGVVGVVLALSWVRWGKNRTQRPDDVAPAETARQDARRLGAFLGWGGDSAFSLKGEIRRWARQMARLDYSESFERELARLADRRRNPVGWEKTLDSWGKVLDGGRTEIFPQPRWVQLEVVGAPDLKTLEDTLRRVQALNRVLESPLHLIWAAADEETRRVLEQKAAQDPRVAVVPFPVGGAKGVDFEKLNAGFRQVLLSRGWDGPLRLNVGFGSVPLPEGRNPWAAAVTDERLREALRRCFQDTPAGPVDFNLWVRVAVLLAQNA